MANVIESEVSVLMKTTFSGPASVPDFASKLALR